jgi:uncharacterized protein YhfF
VSEKTAETEVFWRAFCEGRNVTGDHVVVALGDSAEMADELAALVLAGRKRATASLVREFADRGEPLPQVGDLVVVVDGSGRPQCIWRTTDIDIKPLVAVDDRFAWDEGEGDRTRQGWLDAHRRYFARQAAREGFAMHDGMEVVFERFEIVWPPSAADR